MDKTKIVETDVAQKAISFLTNEGWDCYQEVCTGYGYSRPDIVCRRGPAIHIVECKTSASLSLLGQALHWTNQCNYVSVAIPINTSKVFYKLCFDYGIGIISTSPECGYVQHPRFFRGEPFSFKWADILCESQKTYAMAGNNECRFYSPFKKTVEQLAKLAIEKPGIKLAEAIKEIEHHYSTDTTAKSCIYQWVRKGVIKEITLENGRIYPVVNDVR